MERISARCGGADGGEKTEVLSLEGEALSLEGEALSLEGEDLSVIPQ
jgi:hypothetical protein